MGMSAGPNRGIKSDINVTPLVDVVLVLLIIFMVVTPMLQRGKDVKLPKAAKKEGEGTPTDPVIVSVTPDKSLWIESEQVSEDKFEEKLLDKMGGDLGKRILLKGDNTLVFEDVRKVMSMTRKMGAKSVFLGVEEEK